VGVGLVGSVSIGATILGSDNDSDIERSTVPPTDQWLFGPFVAGSTAADFDDRGMVPVTVPHCVAPLSWQGWQPDSWEALWVYRQYFDAPTSLLKGRTFANFAGVLSTASVYLNGKLVGRHAGGYLPFSVELTGQLDPRSNVLAVVVDGRWRQDVPPNLLTPSKPSAIDFYQPAGIYRSVTVAQLPQAYLSDVFARPMDVLTQEPWLTVQATIDTNSKLSDVTVVATVTQHDSVLGVGSVALPEVPAGMTTTELIVTGLSDVVLWDIENPELCQVELTLSAGGRQAHQTTVRTGFRDASFTQDGFFLNGRRVKLFGLNRHQWYPYVGGAMPDRVQQMDAKIIKNQLNCNMVRCSHYPQSTAFLDACDELGLMVWEEIPGWDHVGDANWQRAAVQNVHDMVVRDRNHPSVIVWGTRINETLGEDELYDRTDELAAALDGSRPTTGAVKGTPGYRMPLYAGDPDDAVFAFNDYSRLPHPGALAELRPPRPEVAYLVSEAIGTLVGPPTFRRVDPVAAQQDQSMLHAAVHDRAAGDDHYCGLLAWCAFDYPSGWYHSVHGVKYPGVADFFRIPKLGAAFYRAQRDPTEQVVIEPAFYWDFGPHSRATGPGTQAVIWSNCDQLELFLDGRKVDTVRPDAASFPNLDHPPFLADLTVRSGRRPELRIDGYLGGKLVKQRHFSPDTRLDHFACDVDDHSLTADGQDTTRVVFQVLDRYGAPRPFAAGTVAFRLTGPGTLIGDNPFDLAATGGAGAVWLRTVRGATGRITLTATHSVLGSVSAVISTVR
jgi:beta-galactosidase